MTGATEPSAVHAALEPLYDSVELRWFNDGRWGFSAERQGERLALRVFSPTSDPTERIPDFIDGPARARHPALADTKTARFISGHGLIVLEQVPFAEPSGGPDDLDAAERLEAALDIASALAYAHEQGWVHGALGTQSVVLHPTPRLYDLGAAQLCGRTPTPERDVADFVEFLRRLRRSEDPDDPIARWLDGAAGRTLRVARASMRDLEARLGQLQAHARPRPSADPARPDVELEHGVWVDHFQVQRLIGQGGLAEVYLARDTVLGRPVALKLLKTDVVSEPESADLLAEARATATFSHPNIVVVHGVGRYRRRVYLTLEYLPGETLAEVLKGKLSKSEAISLGLAIARALQEAHRQGIVHCDLKPSNVLVPQDGRPRVVDFGLARAFSGAAAKPEQGTTGTPAYMAPEQWNARTLTPAVDIWALGLILFEMVEARPLRTREGLPAGCDPRCVEGQLPAGRMGRLIGACLRSEPTARPSADDVIRALERLGTDALPVEALESPFRGLQSFDVDHARFYVGREDEADQFVRELRHRTYLTLVGPSGAGKSSFIQAAIIPRLRLSGRWTFVRVRPGARPLHALAAELLGEPTHDLRPPVESVAALADRIARRPPLLNLRLHDRADQHRSRILVFVDALEELVTNTADPSHARAFLQAIAGASDGPEDSIRVVATVRDDFVGRLADLAGNNPLLENLRVLRSPDREMMIRCVNAPLAAVGYRLTPPELAERMVDDLQGASAQLPLLQFTCGELWHLRDAETSTISETAYDRIGGVQGALALRADQLMDSMPPAQRAAAKTILLRLVGHEGTRRIRSHDALVEDLADGERALKRLEEGRLVATRRHPDDHHDGTTYELVHEALLQSWAKLRRWAEDTREERKLVEELKGTVTQWIRRGAPADEAWDGDTVRRWQAKFDELRVKPPHDIRRFFDAGLERERRYRGRRRAIIWSLFSVTVLIAVVATLAALAFADQAKKINQAAANLGRFELVIRPFDLEPTTGRPRPALTGELPNLRWSLLDLPRTSQDVVGDPIDPFVEWSVLSKEPTACRYRVEVRGGPAFLSVVGRGRNKECGPSLLRLQRLPGYSERNDDVVVEVSVPTCQATMLDVADVPAGPFIHGGSGEPKTTFPEYVEPEREIMLLAYDIDRFEVSNRALRTFTRMADVTGLPAPIYPKGDPRFEQLSGADHPAVQVSYRTAVAYCRFFGKRLPTAFEWEKAARGGLTLPDGQTNPMPRRNQPWGHASGPRPANILGDADGHPSTAPVNAHPDGRSPYGVFQLAGNAAEWTSTAPPTNPQARIVKGGDWTSPEDLEHWYIVYDNERVYDDTDLAVGFRCARSH